MEEGEARERDREEKVKEFCSRYERDRAEENGEDRQGQEGPSLHDVKRALRHNFRETGVIDDVTVSQRRRQPYIRVAASMLEGIVFVACPTSISMCWFAISKN